MTQEYPSKTLMKCADMCAYIKKAGVVSDCLMKGYECALAEKHPSPEHGVTKEQGDEIA